MVVSSIAGVSNMLLPRYKRFSQLPTGSLLGCCQTGITHETGILFFMHGRLLQHPVPALSIHSRLFSSNSSFAAQSSQLGLRASLCFRNRFLPPPPHFPLSFSLISCRARLILWAKNETLQRKRDSIYEIDAE